MKWFAGALVAAGLLLAVPGLANPPAGHRMELDRSAIRGNRELPRVMYIVPWKDPAAAELSGRPLNSLIEDVLGPLDREVFRRELSYFEQLHANGPTAAGATTSDQEFNQP